MTPRMSGAYGGRFARNTFWLVAQDGYTLLLMLVVGVFSARYLGPEGYGLLNYSMSFVAVFAAFCKLGLDYSIMNALVSSPLDAGRIVASALVMRTIAAAISQLGLLAAVGLVRGGDKLLLALTLLHGVSLFFDSRQVLDVYFQYRLESRNSAIAQIAGVTVMCAMRAVMIIARADIIWFALAAVMQSLVGLCASAMLFRRNSNVRLEFSLAQAKRLLTSGAFFMLAGAAAALHSRIDRLMIGSMLSDAHVGWYSVASFVAIVGTFVPNAFVTSAKSMLLTLRREDDAEFEAKLQALVFGILALSAILGVGLFALGPFAISLVYGAAYAPAGLILRVLCFSALFSSVNSARELYILANGLNRYSLVFALMGAAVNILLNAFMIPLWGVNGAAAATMCAYVTTSLLAPLMFPKTRPFVRLVVTSPLRSREALKLLRELGRGWKA